MILTVTASKDDGLRDQQCRSALLVCRTCKRNTFDGVTQNTSANAVLTKDIVVNKNVLEVGWELERWNI